MTAAEIFSSISLTLFPLKLLIGELCFSGYYEKRNRILPRLLVSYLLQGVVSVLLYLLLNLSGSWFLTNTVYFFLQFVVSVAFLRILFREQYGELISAAVASYMTEHTATQVFELLFGWTKEGVMIGNLRSLTLFVSMQVVIFVAVSRMIYWCFARRAAPMEGSQSLKRDMNLLSVATLAVVLFLSSLRDLYAGESYRLMVITRLFSIFSCLTLLYLRYSLLERSRAEHERVELAQVIALERKQMEQSRENIELINIKCHDLRHRIDHWEQRGAELDDEELHEVKRLIGFYDSAVKTGNETLDTILTERSLYCEKEGIRLSVIADGEKLDFMSTGDICALFGNAVENAIDAVAKLNCPEDRIISLQVRENRGMLIITVDNYYSGHIVLRDGLPQTTKEDPLNHGFGTKSIRRIAEKYGGEASITADEMFHLAVILPIPQNSRQV